jgi:magnesium-transporting ATPase (P-type)
MIVSLHSCFLSHVAAFWASFLGPLLLVMIFNIVIFVCVFVVLIRHLRSRALEKEAGIKGESIDGKSIIRLMISIGGVMFLFGLTWLFAIFTFRSPEGGRETFLIVFTVLNSLQGFFVFMFICVISSDARDEWKKVFKWRTQTSMTKGTKLITKNSSGMSNTMDSKQTKCNSYALDTLPKVFS